MSDLKKLINTKEAAEYLNLKPQTLHNYRFKGCPPDYVKIGRRIMYEIPTLDLFIESKRVKVSV